MKALAMKSLYFVFDMEGQIVCVAGDTCSPTDEPLHNKVSQEPNKQSHLQGASGAGNPGARADLHGVGGY